MREDQDSTNQGKQKYKLCNTPGGLSSKVARGDVRESKAYDKILNRDRHV